jgi:hypothetical protein
LDTSEARDPQGQKSFSLSVQDADYDAEGLLTEFLEFAAADSLRNTTAERFRTNTKQMDIWVRRMEKLQRTLDGEDASLRNHYQEGVIESEYGCLRLHIDSPHLGICRRMKAKLLASGGSPKTRPTTSSSAFDMLASSDVSSNGDAPKSHPDTQSPRPGSSPSVVHGKHVRSGSAKMTWDRECERQFRRRVNDARQQFAEEASKGTDWGRLAMTELICERNGRLPNRHMAGLKRQVKRGSLGRCASNPGTSKVYEFPGAFSEFHSLALRRGISEEVVEEPVAAEAEMIVTVEILEEHNRHMQEASRERCRYFIDKNVRQHAHIEGRRAELAKKQKFVERRRQCVKEAARVRVWLQAKERGRLHDRSQSSPQFKSSFKIQEIDNARFMYTGGPPDKRPVQHHQVQARAARTIQRCWRKFKAAWRKTFVEYRHHVVAEHRRSQMEMDALQEAAAQERLRVSKLKSEYKANPEHFADNDDAKLIHCVRSGFLDELTISQVAVHARPSARLMALFIATLSDNAQILAYLLDSAGCCVDWCNSALQTPLHVAAAAGNVTACTCLLERRADANAVDKQGRRALDVAAPRIRRDGVFASTSEKPHSI